MNVMTKKLSLDLGDVWIGSAISDGLGITCRPYRTIKLEELPDFLQETLSNGEIDTVVVGHPITASGTISEQTKKVESLFYNLQDRFKHVGDHTIKWVLHDERFSTKRARDILGLGKRKKASKELSEKEHSVAAAFILQNYLDRI